MIFYKEKFKAIREQLDLTQEEVARHLGIKRQSVQRWEDGVCYPRKPKIYKIAELFHCSPAEFIEYEPGEYIPKRISKKDFIKRIIESGHGDKVKNAIRIDCFRRSLQNAVMNLDISDDAKVKVYHLIENHIPKPEEYLDIVVRKSCEL